MGVDSVKRRPGGGNSRAIRGVMAVMVARAAHVQQQQSCKALIVCSVLGIIQSLHALDHGPWHNSYV